MRIGLIGLGKMGMGIAERVLQEGHEVSGISHNPQTIKEFESLGGTPVTEIAQLASLPTPRVVWVMIPAGQPVEDTLFGEQGLTSILEKGDVVIDGGNSHYTDSVRRTRKLAEMGIALLDCGTSGGLTGRRQGYCLMVGGTDEGYAACAPVFNAVAQSGGFGHVGPSGAGHYVKMIHNAIEYGMMQSLAEGITVITEGDYPETDVSKLANIWQHGSIIEANLTGMIADIYKTNPKLDGIDGYIATTGETDWTIEAAKTKGIPVPSFELALDVRVQSQAGQTSTTTKILAALRNHFGGHKINK